MPKLVALILVLVGAIGGGAGGYFAKQMVSGAEASEGDHADGDHGDDHGDDHSDDHKDDHSDDHGDDHDASGYSDKKKSNKKKKASGKGKGDDASAGDDGAYGFNNGLNYFKFSRQFVVPIIAEHGVRALVLLDLNLEMDADAAESFYVREPKLRDVLMIELLDIANEGRFDGVLTDRKNLDMIRIDLVNAVRDVEGDSVHDVLILDIMRQDL